ncbi:MAG: 4-hydroxybenzoate octaprenyltransferase [Rubrimonas sp.]
MNESIDTAAAARDGRVADATADNWVDRFAPPAIRPYLRLSRADRPAGTWLLLLPCLWSLSLAAAADRWTAHDVWLVAAFAIGAFLMRGAGCTWNDVADWRFDARVARTRSRPIPSGQVTVRAAMAWGIAQALVAFCVLLTFNGFAIAVGVSSLLFVTIYPFMKRYTWWPQVFLGLAFNWGALMGWAGHFGSLGPAPILLYLGGIAWTLHYDTIYAHQDRADDEVIGVKSTARLFAERTPQRLAQFSAAAVALIGAAVVRALWGDPLALAVAMTATLGFAAHLVWQLRRVDIQDPGTCLAIFRANCDAGLILAVGFTLASLI